MGASIRLSVLACACLVGCTSSVQVGLANAPVLGGATVETRVHDVIANGRDSCERSTFPQGDVLRGHIPPCVAGEPDGAGVLDFSWLVPPVSPWRAPGYPLGACPHAWPGPTGAEKGMTAISLSSSGRLVCSGAW
jgi:hypothetical protein